MELEENRGWQKEFCASFPLPPLAWHKFGSEPHLKTWLPTEPSGNALSCGPIAWRQELATNVHLCRYMSRAFLFYPMIWLHLLSNQLTKAYAPSVSFLIYHIHFTSLKTLQQHLFLPLFPRVQWTFIHFLIIFCPEVINAAIVTKSSPFCIDAHPAFIPFDNFYILHFFHVAHVTARPWEKTKGSCI